MKGCYNCAHGAWLNGEDDLPEICVECNYAPGYPSKWEEKRITNADRIRAMSDEELAETIPCPYMRDCYDECKFGWHERTQTCEECKLEWLRQPVKDGDN